MCSLVTLRYRPFCFWYFENLSAQNYQYIWLLLPLNQGYCEELSGHSLRPEVAPCVHLGQVAIALLWPSAASSNSLIWRDNIFTVFLSGKYHANAVSRSPLTSKPIATLRLEPLQFAWFKQELLVCHHLLSFCYLTLSWILETWEPCNKNLWPLLSLWMWIFLHVWNKCIMVFLKKDAYWLNPYFLIITDFCNIPLMSVLTLNHLTSNFRWS